MPAAQGGGRRRRSSPPLADPRYWRRDVAAAFAQRAYMTSNWDDSGQVPWLKSKGIELIRGRGRLAGEKVVEVEPSQGTTRRLTANRAVVLACGTVPLMPPIEGLGDVGAWDNRDATAAKELPRRLVGLGGGPIGVGVAPAVQRLGAEEGPGGEGGEQLLARG